MHSASNRAICCEQPAVAIHSKLFSARQESVPTFVRSDTGPEAYSMAQAHGGQPGTGLAQAIVKNIAPRIRRSR